MPEFWQCFTVLWSVSVGLRINNVIQRGDWDAEIGGRSEYGAGTKVFVADRPTVTSGNVAEDIDAATVGAPGRRDCSDKKVWVE